ncbi:30S ribosomal protein S12 methylthiotransferase RimO [candidate division WOR-3 bacterium]|nr:30S ribosomal protein S12 methylthiotransferase RimO [candidate division WOR-3 bacterium]
MKDIGKTFYLETLGCPRNETDSEAIINILTASGFELILFPEKADIIIVNGCAFINDAVSESIDSILALRNKNKRAVLLVVGCLAQRYGQDLLKTMPEVDLLAGTGSIENIPEIITAGRSEVNSNCGFLGKNLYRKPHVTPQHYRYIKIQEGCDFRCSFCVIPALKGKSHSKKLADIKEEISDLPESVKEIIFIGQNTTSWGRDFNHNASLSDVIKEIAPIFPGWIRFLYFHPLAVSEELLKTMQELPDVVNYLDIPLQHVSDYVLSDMNRGYGRNEIENLLELIKSVGDFTLRTTFIVGFPSETEKNFEELCSFVEKSDIDHIGVFGYSHEEGSVSYSMPKLSDDLIMRRMEIISSIIEEKAGKRNEKFIGETIEVLIDGIEEGEYYGRTKTSAPEIDPVVWLSPAKKPPEVGKIYRALITDALGSDITGEIVP